MAAGVLDCELAELTGGCPNAGASCGTPKQDGESCEEEAPSVAAFRLVGRNSFEEARCLLEASPELWHEQDCEGHTLLHWGALAGHVAFVSHAVAAGARVDALALNGQTPLMWAVIRGQLAAAKVLLQAQADPHVKDSLGATPLILAAQHQRHAVLLLLLTAGKQERMLREADVNGCAAAHWAAYKGDLVGLRLLDYFNADLSATDGLRMTTLHRVVQAAEGSLGLSTVVSVCEFLLNRSVDPSQVDSQGRTFVDLASLQQDKTLQKVLGRLMQRRFGAVSIKDVGDIEGGKGAAKRRDKGMDEELARLREKAIHNAAPTFWLVSVSLAVFQYLTDLRVLSWRNAPVGALCFELGVPATLALFLWVSMANPGKVPPRPKTASGVEEFMAALTSCSEDSLPDFGRLCTTTWVMKGLRTKYCVRTEACVEEFDHFCGWLNVAIGRDNHRAFVVLALVEVFTQLCHLYLCFAAAAELVRGSSIFGWVMGLATGYPLLAFVVFVHVFTAPGILFLAISHLRLVAANLTTNESINLFRYDHFWVEDVDTGRFQKTFRNPFDKGSSWLNCLDFWWERRRAERGPQAPPHGARALGAGSGARDL